MKRNIYRVSWAARHHREKTNPPVRYRWVASLLSFLEHSLLNDWNAVCKMRKCDMSVWYPLINDTAIYNARRQATNPNVSTNYTSLWNTKIFDQSDIWHILPPNPLPEISLLLQCPLSWAWAFWNLAIFKPNKSLARTKSLNGEK